MKKLFFLPALAAMMFSSCSSDEPTVDNPADQVGERYVAVTIKNVGSIGGRATTSTENGATFEEGIGNESSITAENLRFYFFTPDGRPFIMNSTGVNGTVSNTNMVKPAAINQSTTNGKVTDIEATLVLGTEAGGYKGNKPAYVFCVANLPAGTDGTVNWAKFANKRMSDIYDEFENAPSTLTADGSFVMTSSTYADNTFAPTPNPFNGKVIFFSDLTGKIKSTPEDAKANPAEIYLERLAAKVRAHGLTTYIVQQKGTDNKPTPAKFTVKVLENGAIVAKDNVELKVELTGWRLRNTAKTAFSIKNISENWLTTAPFDAWNIAELHRCFWATSKAVSANDVERVPYNIYDASQFSLGNFDASTVEAEKQNIAYCFENTAVQPASQSDRTTIATAMVVRGIVKMNDQPVNLCSWGGEYFTEEAFKQMIIENYNADKNAADQLTADAVGFAKYTIEMGDDAKSNTWYAYVTDKNNQPIHTNYRFHNIHRWEAGQTSYYVNIEHMGGKFGVVRNHIYDYTFSNVIGLGVPGNDPKNPDPETETYLAARVMVLNWHLLSKNIVLE